MFGSNDCPERLYGKYPGIVVDNEPPNGPDTFQGQIRVKISPVLGEDGSPIEAWAKPCFHPGFFFIPEIGDNVWVEFVAGDINFPIWAGVWYPQGSTPKTSRDASPATENKAVRTPGGHVVHFDDTSGTEQVIVKHTSGASVEMLEDGSVQVKNQQGETIELKDGSVQVKNQQGTTIELKDGKLTITANEAVEVNAAEVVVSGGTVDIGNAATQSAVLGEMLVSAFSAHMHPTAVGPTGPPMPLPPPLAISSTLSGTVKVAF